jgi:HK97 family phage major capsid protein
MTDAEIKAAKELAERQQVEAIKSAVKAEVEPLKAEIKTATEKNIELQAKLDTIEKSPVFKAPVMIRPSEYRGYKMKNLLTGVGLGGTNLRETFMKGDFGVLKSEEAQDDFAKNMLDCLHAADDVRNGRVGNSAAKQALYERRQELIKKTNANNEGTASEGGYLVAPEYQWDIIKLARNTSYALKIARVVNMISNVQYVPTEASMGVVTWEAEGATKTPSEPTFGQVQLTAKKAFCLARVTNEELADANLDLAGMLTEQFAYATGQDIDNQMLNGNGSPWSGLLSTVTQSVVLSAGASISTLTFTDLSLVIAQILEARLEGAQWLVSRLAKHYIRSLKDSNGRPIFAMPGNGVPGTIWEYPYSQSEKMPNTDGASKKMALFGNFKYAILGRRQGVMNIDVDPYGLFDSDSTRFRMTTRWGFASGDNNAFCLVKNAAS